MPNVPLFSITNVVPTAQAAIDTIIQILGKPCRLVYPPLTVACNNCGFDSIGKRSTGTYIEGGPQPFPRGQNCPLCGGKYWIEQQQTDSITMLISFNPKEWASAGLSIPESVNIRVPGGSAMSKGFLTDLPKIRRAKEVFLATNVEAYTRLRYTLAGEPLDVSNIVQGRYFVAFWNRC